MGTKGSSGIGSFGAVPPKVVFGLAGGIVRSTGMAARRGSPPRAGESGRVAWKLVGMLGRPTFGGGLFWADLWMAALGALQRLAKSFVWRYAFLLVAVPTFRHL